MTETFATNPMDDEELMASLAEELGDFETAKVTYDVWAVGYDRNNEPTNSEVLMDSFEDPNKAVEYAKQLTLSDIVQKADEVAGDVEPTNEIAYISVEVETVIDDIEEGRYAGAIYKSKIWVREEDLVREDLTLLESDYSVLEDGTLRVDCEPLEGFNEGDYIVIKFVNRDSTSILTYEILSKGKDYFLCELVIR